MANISMSIFGNQAPKFIAGETEVNLDYCVVLQDEADLEDILHQSKVTGHREWSHRGKHWIFKVKIHLFKYEDVYSAYQNFKQYEHQLVTLYKRRDGNPVTNLHGEEVKFFIENIEEGYLQHYLYPDILFITFLSQDPIDLPLDLSPLDISGIKHWFADDTLENPSDNNFIWTDKITGTMTLSGDYGSGDGIVQVNGFNVLNIDKNGDEENQLNTTVDIKDMTFIGMVKHTLPSKYSSGFSLHLWLQPGWGSGSGWALGFSQHASGGTNFSGIIHSATNGFTPSYFIGYGGTNPNWPTEPNQIPFMPVFFAFRFKFGAGSNLLKLNLNDVQYSSSESHGENRISFWNIAPKFTGNVFEFMFFDKILTDEEVNYLRVYYAEKYAMSLNGVTR